VIVWGVPEKLLGIEKLSVEYRTEVGRAKAVRDVSLDLMRGETLGLVGESGSGKSTLGLAVMGLLPPPAFMTGGKIQFGSELVSSMKEEALRKIRGKRIAMIFQDPMTSLNPVKKVGDHFIEYIRTHEPNIDPTDARESSIEVLRDMGISPERFDDYPHQFSGGMRQRVMIGLALVLKPELIIADEPTTALDVIVEAQILRLLRGLKEKYSLSVILITHNMGIVAEMADRVAVMYGGRIAEVAPTLEIFEAAKHPYTQALLQSIPTVEAGVRKLKVIPGFPPNMTDLPSGCSFHPRCPYRFEKCIKEDPPLVTTGPQAKAACHLLTKEG
jgi:oligopeptide/dipeptide ABC transporter ATP-binding protein